ncbi:MAG: tetratricopeptide repeat protein [Polyangiaceae bacterium]|nr:tetratricopeptide repeat protein [Polyangiaceae bacterium]
MSAENIRKALALLAEDPDSEEAWLGIEEAVTDPGDEAAQVEQAIEMARADAERAREWRTVARLLALETEFGGDSKILVPKLLELARIQDEELCLVDAAIATWKSVQKARPGDKAAAEAILRHEAAAARWADAVERCLVEALDTEDATVRSRSLATAAETAFRYGSGTPSELDKIVDYLEQALAAHKSNWRAAVLAELVYTRRGDWHKLAVVLRHQAAEGPRKEDRAAAARRLARLCLHKLGDEDAALDAYQSVLDYAPADREAFGYLVRHFSETEAWDHLVALYEDQLQSGTVKGADELGMWMQIAMINWKRRNQPDAAEAYFEKVRRAEPTNPGMLQYFRERFGASGDTTRLSAILTDASRATEDAKIKRALQEEVASLAEGQENARGAIEQYKAILRTDPDNDEARDALKRLYRQTESYTALVELLRQDLSRLPKDDAAGRIAVLREIAGIYGERMKSDTQLLTVLTHILQLDENDIAALRALTTVYESLARWRDLLQTQQKLAQVTPSTMEKVSLYRSIARRWLEQFSNVQNAIQSYESLLEAAPEDGEAREQLRDLYKKRRAWPKLYDLYEAQVDSLEGERRVALMIEMAQLAAERLDRGADAIRLLKEVLVFDPKAEGVLDALEKQAERQKDFQTVAYVLEHRVEEAGDDAQRLTLLQKLGQLYAERLEDHVAASRAWRRVLDLSPGHQRALRVLRKSYVAVADWDGLEELYRSQSDWEGLADFLSTTADRAEVDEHKVELSFRAARVYEGELAAPERAVRSYERILSVEPHNVKAAQALLPLYETEEKWARLPTLYGVLLEASDDLERKIDILQKVAEITGGPLANKSAALSYARRAYELRPDGEGLERLEAWSRQSGEWTAFIEAVQQRLAKGGDLEPAAERALKQKLARVYSDEVERTDDAIEMYTELVKAEPGDAATVALLEDQLRAADRREELRWLLDLKVGELEGEDKCRALEEWASVEEEAFGEPARAIALLRRVVEIDGSRTATLAALTRLLVAAKDYAGAVVVMAAHRDVAEGDVRADLEIGLAELYLAELGAPGLAFEAVTRALELRANHPPAVRLLERLLVVPETRRRAAAVLVGLYAASGQPRQQTHALRALLESERDPAERLALSRRLVTVLESELADAASAFDAALAALAEFPDDLGLWDTARTLARAAGRPTDIAEAYRTHLQPARPRRARATLPLDDRTHDGEQAADAEGVDSAPAPAAPSPMPVEVMFELCQRAAALHEDELGDAEGAIPYLERVLAAEATNRQALERLKNILIATERWSELEQLFERAVEAAASDAERVELLHAAAVAAEDMMGDDAKAIAYFERVLGVAPAHSPAQKSLEKLYAREERWSALAALLETRLSTAEGAEAQRVRLRLVDLYLHQLAAPGSVMAHLADALARSPEDNEARELAEECLGVPELRQPAAELLDGVYQARDDMRDLVRILGVRLEGAAELAARRELLRRIAELRDERLRDDAGAFEAIELLLPLEPEDAALRTRMQEIGRRLGAWSRMADALVLSAQASAVASTRGEILMAAAALFRGELADPTRAEAVYRQVIDIDPNDATLVIPAARALGELHLAAGKHAELAGALGIEVRLVQDAAESAALYRRIAELYEGVLDDKPRAIEAWKGRLAENAADGEALAALERLYERSELWRELVDTLRQIEQGTEAVEERKRCMTKAASVLADRLGDTGEAIIAWRAVLDDFGPEPTTLSALADLYEVADRWDDLAEVLDVWLTLSEGEAERIALFTRLGDVRRAHLADPQGALTAYREVLVLDPSHAGARAGLEAMLESPEPDIKREAAETIRPLYEADGDAARLLKVLDIEVEATLDPLARLVTLKNALVTAEETVQDPGRAFDYAARGLREALGDPSVPEWIATCERLAAATERWRELCDLYESVVEDILDADEQQKVRLRAGELARVRLEDQARAIRHYRAALDARAEDTRAMRALEELYEATGDSASLLGILKLRTEATEADPERIALLYRTAELEAGPLGDARAAIDSYEALIDIALEDKAVTALDALYRKEARFDNLVTLYERQLESAGVATAAQLRVQIAAVAREKLDDVPRALDELSEALNLDPTHAGAVAALEAFLDESQDPEHRGQVAALLEPYYLRMTDWQKLHRVLEARLESCQDPSERADLLRQLATLYDEQLEDYPAATETVAKLLRDEPGDESIWKELERLSKVTGNWKRLAEIYAESLKEVGADDPSTARLCERTGELFAQVGAAEDALVWYRRAHEFSPDSPELFAAIDGLLVKLDRAAERVDLYRASLDHAADDAARVAALHIIAALERDKLGRTDDAIRTLNEICDIEPQNEAALEALTALYRGQQKEDDLADLYLRRAEQASDAASAAPHRLDLARLLRPSDPDRALDQLETIVIDLPSHAEAIAELESFIGDKEHKGRVLEILRPVYERGQDWRGLVRLGEERLTLLEEPSDKVEVWMEIAGLWEVQGEDPKRACAVVRQAFELVPADEPARAALERLTAALGAWPALADSYTRAIAAVDDELVKRQLCDALATVCDKRLDDPRRALDALARLAELEPDELGPLERMERLCLLLSDWTRLVAVLERQAELTPDVPAQAAILRRIGGVKQEMLEDEAGAVATYERALDLEPDAPVTLDRLIALYELRDDKERLAELYERRVELTAPDDALRYDLTLRCAELFEGPLHNAQEAIRMYGQALDVRAGDTKVLVALQRLYAAEEQFEDLLENLKLQASAAETQAARLALRNQIGDLYIERFENVVDALEQYRLVLDEVGVDEHAIGCVRKIGEQHADMRLEVAALLEPVLERAGRHAELVAVMELRLAAQSDAPERAATLRSMARIEETELKNTAAARDALLRALDEIPEEQSLHDDITRLCELTGDWTRYADALEARGEAVLDAEVAGGLFRRLGWVCEEKLAAVERAIAAYGRAVEQAGDEPELLTALDRLYVRTGDHEKLAGVLERRVMSENDPAVRADLYQRFGDLQIERHGDKQQGVAMLRQAVEIVPDHAGARKSLEGLTDDAELFEEVSELLEGIYRVAGDTAALARLYEKRIGHAPGVPERVRMRFDLARVLEEQARDLPGAQRVMEKSFADDCTNNEILAELERLAKASAAAGEGAQAWRRAAEAVSTSVAAALGAGKEEVSLTPDLARDLYLRVAEWYKSELSDPAAAEVALRQAHHQDPRSVDALTRLEEIQRAPGREQDLCATLRALAELYQSGAAVGREPAALRREAKVLAETTLGDTKLAEQILRDMLQANDADLWALGELTSLREKAGDFQETYALLCKRVELRQEPELLRDLRRRAAEIAEQKLDKPEAAADLHEQAFEEDPSDAVAAEALKRLYAKLERYEDMLRLTERLTDRATTPAERAALRLESARICISVLEAPTEGIEHLHAVLAEVPGHEGAVLMLSGLLEKEGRDDELAELLQKQIDLAKTRGEREAELAFRLRLADVYESRLNQPERALEGYLGVLERDGKHRGALEAAARLYQTRSEAPKAAAMQERLLAGTLDDLAAGGAAAEVEEQAVRIALKACELYLDAGDREAACKPLESVLAARPARAEINDKLRSLYKERGAWDKLAELIAREAERAPTPGEKVSLYVRAAEIQTRERQDHGAAASLLEKALAQKADDRDLLLQLCDAYTAAGRSQDAVAALNRVVDSYGGRRSKELADIHHRIASAHIAGGDLAAALADLESARKMDPGAIKILHELGLLSIRLADAASGDEKKAHLDRASNTFRSLLLQRLEDTGAVSKGEVFFLLAEVSVRQGEPKKGIQMCERALSHDKNHERAKKLLAELKAG